MELNMNMNSEDWSWFAQQLRGKIADSHTLIEKIRDLEAQNNVLQSKFDSLSVSFRDLNDLYSKETKKILRLQDELREGERKWNLQSEENKRLIGENRFLRLQSEQLGAVDMTIGKLEKEKAVLKRRINEMQRKCSKNHISRKIHARRNRTTSNDGEISEKYFPSFGKFPDSSNVDYGTDMVEPCSGNTTYNIHLDLGGTVIEDKHNAKLQEMQYTETPTSDLFMDEDKPEKLLISTPTITEDPQNPEACVANIVFDILPDLSSTVKENKEDIKLHCKQCGVIRTSDLSKNEDKPGKVLISVSTMTEGDPQKPEACAENISLDILPDLSSTAQDSKQNAKLQCSQSIATQTSELPMDEDKPKKVFVSTSTMTENPQKPEVCAAITSLDTLPDLSCVVKESLSSIATQTLEMSKVEDKPEKVLVSTSTMTEDPQKPELIAKSTMTESVKVAVNSTSTMTVWSSMQTCTKSTLTDEVQEKKSIMEIVTQSAMDDVTQKVLSSQFTMTVPSDTNDCATSCNLYEEQKSLIKYVSCGTQHKYSTTTRSTCTSAFIKKHNVGTNFPESWPVSIEQILKETIMDLPDAIEPIEELPDHMLPRSVGTNTVIKDIRKSVGFMEALVESNSANKTNSIKVEREMAGKKNSSDRLESSLKTMWSLFGNIIIAMICRKRESDGNSEELLAREFENMIQNLSCNNAEDSSRKDVTTNHRNDIVDRSVSNEKCEKSSVCTEKQKERSPLRATEESCFKVEENSNESLQNVGNITELNDSFHEESIQPEIIHNNAQVCKSPNGVQMDQDVGETTVPKKATESSILFANIAQHPNISSLKTDQTNTKGKRKKKKKLLGHIEKEKNSLLPSPHSVKLQRIAFIKGGELKEHSELSNVSTEVQTFVEPSSISPPKTQVTRTCTNLENNNGNSFVVPKNESSLKVLSITQVKNNLQNRKLQTVDSEVPTQIESSQSESISSSNSMLNIHHKEDVLSNNSSSSSPSKTFSPIKKLPSIQDTEDVLHSDTAKKQDWSKISWSNDKMHKKVRRISFSAGCDPVKTVNEPTNEKSSVTQFAETNKQNLQKQKEPFTFESGFKEPSRNLESESETEVELSKPNKTKKSSPIKEQLVNAAPAKLIQKQDKDTEMRVVRPEQIDVPAFPPQMEENEKDLHSRKTTSEPEGVPIVEKYAETELTQINKNTQTVAGTSTKENKIKDGKSASKTSRLQSENESKKENPGSTLSISNMDSSCTGETEAVEQKSNEKLEASGGLNGTFASCVEKNLKKSKSSDAIRTNLNNVEKIFNNLSDSDSDDDASGLQICFGDEILPDLSSDDDESNIQIKNETLKSGNESKITEDCRPFGSESLKDPEHKNFGTIMEAAILPELSLDEEADNAITDDLANAVISVTSSQYQIVEASKSGAIFDDILPEVSSDEEDAQDTKIKTEHVSKTDKELPIFFDDEQSSDIPSFKEFEKPPENTDLFQLPLSNEKGNVSECSPDLDKSSYHEASITSLKEDTFTSEIRRKSTRKRKLSNVSVDINTVNVTKKVRRKSYSEGYERDNNDVVHDFVLENKLSHLLENELDLPSSIQPIDDISDDESDEISLPTCKSDDRVENVKDLQDFSLYESPLSPGEASSETSISHPIEIPLEWKSARSASKRKQKKINSYMGSILSKYEKQSSRCIPVKRTKESRSDQKQSETLKDIINSYLVKDFNNILAPQIVEEITSLTNNVRLISLAIVHAVMNINEVRDADFTCQPSELDDQIRIVLALVDELKQWKPDIVNDILFYIEKSIFVLNMKSFVYKDLVNATCLYLRLAQMRSSRESPLRTFIFKCLYYHADWGLAMIYYTLLVHPKVLPHEKEPVDDALTLAIKCILNSTPFNFTKPKQQELSAALKFRYGYQRVVPSKEDAIKILMNKIHSGHYRNVSYAINLICRKNNEKWRTNIVELSLIPTLEEFCKNSEHGDEDDKKIAVLLECISLIIKAYPVTYDVSPYQQIFFNILNNNKRKTVQEAAMRALLRLSRFGLVDCFNRTVKWKSRGRCSRVLKLMVQTLVYRKPFSYWKKLIDSNSMDKE